MKKLLSLNLFLLASLFTFSQIINVPADFPTIQEGINAASDGDTVLIAEDTYLENINFTGKAITVASNFIIDGDTSHIRNTIIDGSQPDDPDLGSVVTFNSEEDTTSILCGFTVTGGTGTLIQEGNFDLKAGGGINFVRSGGKVLNNYIEYNIVNYQELTMGGGISAGGPIDPLPWLVLRGNNIRYNKSISQTEQANSGGVEIYYNLIMVNNVVNNNEVISPVRSITGGVSIRFDFGHIDINVRYNLITQNRSVSNNTLTDYSKSGGLFIGRKLMGTVSKNTVTSNKYEIADDNNYYFAGKMKGLTGTVSNNTISFNEIEVAEDRYCVGAGAMIGYAGTDFIFENNFIINNYCSEGSCYGGGLCIFYGGGTYQNNVIQDNAGTWGGGISIGNNNIDSLAILINNTVTGNESIYGGGLYLTNADAVVVNSILWNNKASQEGDEIYNVGSNLEVMYSNIEGGWPGNGNMDVDPIFCSDGYHLYYPSMLVNEGISSILINDEWYESPEYDNEGDERPFDWTEPDIGADEAQWYYVSVDKSILSANLFIRISPNPFTTTTIIEYELKQPEKVFLNIYSHLGQLVYQTEENQPQGKQQIIWNGEGNADGIYYYRLQLGEKVANGKMVKVK